MNQTHRNALAAGERAGLRYALGLPRHAPRGRAGVTLGRGAGSSLEFREYRDYQPGDDLRHIDWNVSARTDTLSVKLFREEVTPHLDLVLDRSRSMDLDGTAKADAALGLTAFFVAAAGNAGFSHAAWLMGRRFDRLGPPNSRPAGWEITFDEKAADPNATTGQVGQDQPKWRPRGMRVLISDLLWPGDPLAVLGPFAEQAAGVAVIQLLAAADADPPTGPLRLVDRESDGFHDLVVDAAAVRRYHEALARHQQQWFRACRQVGAVFVTAIAERVVREWTLDELVAAELLRVR